MNYKKNYILLLNKIIKRNINTTVLKDLLSNLVIDKNFYKLKGKITNDDLTNNYNKLLEKNIKVDKKEFDYINIGALLTRLGIRIFANNNSNQIPQTVNTSPIVINNIIPSGNTNRSIGQGFFRQLGVKVLELLEVFIENMKNKKQKYK